MSKLDLSSYSDREIITAFFNLPVRKFIAVLAAMSKAVENRGRKIGEDEDDIVDHMIRQLFEENE